MSRYDLSLGVTVTKDGKPFLTHLPTTWHNLDADGLAAMVGFANAIESEVKKVSNKGGSVSITLAGKIVALDGGPLPPGSSNDPTTYSGLTLHGLSDVEEAMASMSANVVKMGRTWAEHREGKRKK